jgi:hypothetical protein
LFNTAEVAFTPKTVAQCALSRPAELNVLLIFSCFPSCHTRFFQDAAQQTGTGFEYPPNTILQTKKFGKYAASPAVLYITKIFENLGAFSAVPKTGLCGTRQIFGQATRTQRVMAIPLNTGFLPVVFVRDEFGVFIPHEGPGVLYRPIRVGFKKFRVNFIETAAFFSGEDACRLFDLQQNNKRNIIIAKKVRIGYIFHVFFSLSTSLDNALSE